MIFLQVSLIMITTYVILIFIHKNNKNKQNLFKTFSQLFEACNIGCNALISHIGHFMVKLI